MILKQFFDDISCTLTYILADAKGAPAIIIDPVKKRVPEYMKFFSANDLLLVKAIDTHIHADHVTGLGELRKLLRCMTLSPQKAWPTWLRFGSQTEM